MRLLPPLLLAFVAGCATIVGTLQLDDRFGPADPARFDHPPAVLADAPDYWKDVRPLLDQRWCFMPRLLRRALPAQPDQLCAGPTRGANPKAVYSSVRLVADEPTRLGFDALTNASWRQKGFSPVLNERAQTPEANREGGVMHCMLALKQTAPGPDSGPVTNADLDFSLDRKDTCTRAETFGDYASKHPERGMPFAMPPLTKAEHQTLARWLEAGAPLHAGSALAGRRPGASRRMGELPERRQPPRANGGALHLRALVHRPPAFPRRRRDATSSSSAAARRPASRSTLAATRRPYDDPGVPRVYYRLRYK